MRFPGRNICPLNDYSGKPMTLYYVAYSKELKEVSAHIDAKEIDISGDLEVTKEPLPEGTYLYRFVVRDVFGNRIDSGELNSVNWDGKNVSFPTEE